MEALSIRVSISIVDEAIQANPQTSLHSGVPYLGGSVYVQSV